MVDNKYLCQKKTNKQSFNYQTMSKPKQIAPRRVVDEEPDEEPEIHEPLLLPKIIDDKQMLILTLV